MQVKTFFFFLSLLYCLSNYSQEQKFKGWLPEEIRYYKNLKGLAEYVNGKSDIDIAKDSIIQKYLLINEASKDSIYKGTVYSMEYRNGLFTYIPKTINEYGLGNLDTKPLRFYKETDSIYIPFIRALKEVAPFVMVYYLKKSPEKPLGTLLFDPETYKLNSWILLKQGDSGWFYL